MLKSPSSLGLLLVLLALGCEARCEPGGSPYTLITNNGYENVVVALNPTVQTTQREQLIGNLTTLLQETSKQLYYTTNKMAYLKEVHFLIPNDWKNVKQNAAATFHSYHKPDIMVAPPNPYHGHQPYGLQSSRCGNLGHYVHLTPGFIDGLKNNKKELVKGAKSVVSAWAQFRFGVFEECGIDGDLVHPHIYLSGSNLAVTSCAANALQGTFQGDCDHFQNLTQGLCKFAMDPDQSSAKPAIMFSTNLTDESQSFCDDSNHKTFAPTKHNILCNGKSTWTVAKTSYDLRSLVPRTDSSVPATTFKTVRAEQDKYVIIVDKSANMKTSERFENILLGISRVVHHHVPEGMEVGSIAFDSKATKTREILPMGLYQDRKVFVQALPNVPTTVTGVNIRDAVTEGIKMIEEFERRNSVEGRSSLVLVTGGDESGAYPIDTVSMCAQLQIKRIRLSVILYVDRKREADRHHILLQKLANCSYGHFFVIADIRSDDPYRIVSREIIETAFREAIDVDDPIKAPVQIYEGTYQLRAAELNSNFYVNERQNITVYVSYDNRVTLDEAILTDPSGKLVDKSLPENNYDDDKNERHITLTLNNVMPGNWSYKVKWTNTEEHTVIVKASAVPTTEQIRVSCWMEVQHTTKHSDGVIAGKTPVVIYAKLMKGQTPIIGAQVVADVIPPPEDSRLKLHRVKLQLSDDGAGDPDITKHDGIYSRYFTQFTTKPGFYAFRVTATDNGVAMIPTEDPIQFPNEPGICANNYVKLKRSEPFFRTALGDTFYVSSVNYSVADPFPPARVSDLHIVDIQQRTIILSWTAVGNDYDNDRPNDPVRSYDIRGSTSREMLTEENFEKAEDLHAKYQKVPRSKEQQNATFNLQHEGVPYYVALRASDGTSNSPVSNAIVVTQSKKEIATANVTPGAVAGIAVAAVILLVLVAVVCIVTRRRSRKRYEFPKFPRVSFNKKKKYNDPVKSAETIEPINDDAVTLETDPTNNV